ncbi:MAG: DNA primase [Hyphomicrobiales bacterium]|nr:DNA primase [Hyphomicrobiales bacterium]MCP5372023.1 DNA primase [Hyphomicrobiales bacterium]
MAFSPRFLDELRARVGLADLIGKRVKLTRKGHEHSGLCPFHKEKTPSFTVNEDKGFYHCFGCGAHGSAFDFVMETEGLSFPEAVERLAALAGMEVPQDSPEERQQAARRRTVQEVVEAAARWFERNLRLPEGRGAMDYLRGRGLDDATIARFRLGYAPDSRGQLKAALGRDGISEDLLVEAGLVIRPEDGGREPYDRFRGRVMFPITDRRGQAIAFGGRILGDGEPKYLNSPETALFHKGTVLYGLAQALPAVRETGTVIAAEGYMDVIALSRAGFQGAVAPLGTALTEDQIRLLWKLSPEPVLCFDGDTAGQRAAGRAAERALPLLQPGQTLLFAVLPAGEDPDSLIARSGPEAFQRVLDAAMPLSEVLWRNERGAGPLATPEQRAALEDRLKKQAFRIEDETVRGHFLSDFRNRVWEAFRAGRGDRGDRRGAAPRRGDRAAAVDAQAVRGIGKNRLLRAERMLAALTIAHPGVFHEVEEELGALHFSQPALDDLRQALIDLLSGDADLDVGEVKRQLAAYGVERAVNDLFSDAVIRADRVMRPDASNDNVLEVWKANMDLLRGLELDGELSRGRQDLADSIARGDDDAWARRRALLAARLGEAGEE